MRLTNEQLINLSKALNNLSTTDLPYRTALKITKNIGTVSDKIEDFQNDERDLISKYAIKDDDGNVIFKEGHFSVAPDKQEEFNTNRLELFNFEVEVEVYTLTDSDLENIKIKPIDLMGLECILGRV